jgi:hypothetical protein
VNRPAGSKHFLIAQDMKTEDSKEVRLHTDETTQETGNIQL